MTPTALPTQSSEITSPGRPPYQVERISFDLGNRFNAITDGTNLLSWPSYCANLSSRQDLDLSAPDFQAGQSFRVEIGGGTYKVGKIAQQLGGKPTFGGDKSRPSWSSLGPTSTSPAARLGMSMWWRVKTCDRSC